MLIQLRLKAEALGVLKSLFFGHFSGDIARPFSSWQIKKEVANFMIKILENVAVGVSSPSTQKSKFGQHLCLAYALCGGSRLSVVGGGCLWSV